VKQIKEEVIPVLERISGNPYDEKRLQGMLEESAKAEDGLVKALQSARRKPSPIDAYFGAVYYVGPIFTAFRGTADAVRYYDALNEEIDERLRLGQGPVTPEGPMGEQRYRLVVEGPPNWTHFRDFWKLFYDMGAVVVASSYTKVGGLYDRGFRHDPSRPMETLADYCTGCYTNLSLLTGRTPGPLRHSYTRTGFSSTGQELQLLLGWTASLAPPGRRKPAPGDSWSRISWTLATSRRQSEEPAGELPQMIEQKRHGR
jgi:bcr-type benzoyl-CoA reductase subunit B